MSATLATMERTRLDDALDLARAGHLVVMCHGVTNDWDFRRSTYTYNCTCGKPKCGKSTGKHPVFSAWTKTATADEQVLRDQFGELRFTPNLGIVLGVQPDGAYIVAVDVDDEDRFASLVVEHGPLPATRCGRSPRGARLIFRLPECDTSALKNITALGGASGVDVKLEGGQVVVVGRNVHGAYKGFDFTVPIAELPTQWVAAITPKAYVAPAPKQRAALASTPTIERVRRYLESMDPSIEGANGSAVLLRAACKIVGSIPSESDQASLLDEFNATKCQPAWSERELAHVLDSARKKNPEPLPDRPLRKSSMMVAKPAQHVTSPNGEDPDDYEEQPEPDDETRVRVSPGVEFVRGDHAELAGMLLGRLPGEPVHDEGALYGYDDGTGLWRAIDRTEQSRVVQSFAGAALPSGKAVRIGANDVSGTIRLAADLAAKDRFFSSAPFGLMFANGFLSVTKDGATIQPHAPEHRARFGYPFDYQPRTPTLFLGFLAALFRDDADRAERITFTQEFFGSSLLGIAPRWQRCLVAVGDGANGKSRLAEIVRATMPTGSTCSIPPQDFGNEYRRAMLAGKRLNIVAELPEAEIIASEAFKGIITGDEITARAIREAPFNYQPVAGHYFAANRLPGTSDTTHAFWRRFVAMRFTRQFKEGDPDRDPNVHTKIIAAELPEIVAWLVDGAVRMLRNEAYTLPPSHDAEIKAWSKSADQVACFLEEATVPSKAQHPKAAPHDWTMATVLHDSYRDWAERAGHRPPLARNKFGTRLAALNVPKWDGESGAFYARAKK